MYSLLVRTVTYDDDECSGSLSRGGETYTLRHFDSHKELLAWVDKDAEFSDYSCTSYYTDLRYDTEIK